MLPLGALQQDGHPWPFKAPRGWREMGALSWQSGAQSASLSASKSSSPVLPGDAREMHTSSSAAPTPSRLGNLVDTAQTFHLVMRGQ